MDQELLDCNIKKFKASLNYIKKSYLGKKKNKRRKEERRKRGKKGRKLSRKEKKM